MKSDAEYWLDGEGARFLERIGLKSGDRVLDFGCGVGHYTIPAARVAGREGRVWALDKDEQVLRELREKARESGTLNIEVGHSSGGTEIDFPGGFFDAVLAFDMLHYLETREELYEEFHRVLKGEGWLAVYPKHREDDHPLSNLAGTSLEEIIEEIQQARFSLRSRRSERLIHDESYNRGVVLVFEPRERGSFAV